MAKIVFVNVDNIIPMAKEAVQVHGPGCGHLKKLARSPFFDAGSPEEWDSAQDFYNDYNADFYAEDGQDGCWDIAFYPCSGLVSKKTVINKMEEN